MGRLIDADALKMKLYETGPLGRQIFKNGLSLKLVTLIENQPTKGYVHDVPRVMKIAELRTHNGPFWIEDRDWMVCVAMAEREREGSWEFATWRDADHMNHDGRGSHVFAKSNYGETWRCWTDKPTEKQRKAAAWDDD